MRSGLLGGLGTVVLVAGWGAFALVGCEDDGDDPWTSSSGTSGTGGTASSTSGTGGSTSSTSGTGGSTSGTGGGGGSTSSGGVAGAMPTDSSAVFLHHSTGGVIWGGGVTTALDAHNTANSTTYAATQVAYPDSPYPWANYPYDYWHLWVDDGGQADIGQWAGVPTLQSFTDVYEVVVFKHCYPVSGIQADSGADISSSTKSVENYQLQYNALRDHLLTFTDNRFIVWTGAALVEASSSTEAGQRARQFFTWVKDVWDVPGDNIYVWDFYELETEGANFLLDQYSAGAGDSHPSSAFAQTVAPYFAARIIDVIEGQGDVGSLTGQ
ncbi:MAG: hypothetical protein JRI68_03770 [Deltaproteobacteria bacterium]|nr:hypothetical protein [Deltaproteobacteria bacterium]